MTLSPPEKKFRKNPFPDPGNFEDQNFLRPLIYGFRKTLVLIWEKVRIQTNRTPTNRTPTNRTPTNRTLTNRTPKVVNKVFITSSKVELTFDKVKLPVVIFDHFVDSQFLVRFGLVGAIFIKIL